MAKKSAHVPKPELVLKREPPAEIEGVAPVFAFPNRSRCPRCGTIDTMAYASHDGVQLRRCQAPTCLYQYKVVGQEI